MRLVSIALFLIATVFAAMSQDKEYSYLSGKFVTITPKPIPEEYKDIDNNGDSISLVVVRSPIDNLMFEGNYLPSSSMSKMPQAYVYYMKMGKGSNKIVIRSDNFHQVEMIFPKPLGQNEMWEIDVEGIQNEVQIAEIAEIENTFKVKISTEPFVELFVDNELISHENPHILEEGIHYIASKYGKYEYSQKINVNHKAMDVDANLGGTVIVKSAGKVEFESIDSPDAIPVNTKDGYYEFGSMVGCYRMEGKPNSLSLRLIKKQIEVDPRSKTVYRFDEMVPYGFLSYHGTHLQPWGINYAQCGNFGFFLSYCTDAISKIDTPYGKTEFIDSVNKKKDTKSTSMTFSAGPMMRLLHKLYLQLGAGWAYYLSTSEPNILTADYKYNSALSTNIEILFRYRSLIIGAGYVHQFVKAAYNPHIENQLAFTMGLAFGI